MRSTTANKGLTSNKGLTPNQGLTPNKVLTSNQDETSEDFVEVVDAKTDYKEHFKESLAPDIHLTMQKMGVDHLVLENADGISIDVKVITPPPEDEDEAPNIAEKLERGLPEVPRHSVDGDASSEVQPPSGGGGMMPCDVIGSTSLAAICGGGVGAAVGYHPEILVPAGAVVGVGIYVAVKAYLACRTT